MERFVLVHKLAGLPVLGPVDKAQRVAAARVRRA